MIELVEGYRPGDLGAIAMLQGIYYEKLWGEVLHFEGTVARELYEFLSIYDPGRDLFLTAHDGDVIVGGVTLDCSVRERPDARIRWFILDERFQGLGLGKRMLQKCLDHAQIGASLRSTSGLPADLRDR